MKKEIERKRYRRLSLGFLIAMVVFGGLAFLLAALDDLPFLAAFLGSSFSIIAVILATLTLPLMAYALSKDRFLIARVLAGGQVVLILVAVYVAMFPHFVLSGTQGQMDLLSTAAPESSIHVLGWALIGGLSIIAPAVVYLMWVFKGQSDPNH